MNRIETYKVTFAKDGMYRTDIVETSRNPDEIARWYTENQLAYIVIAVRLLASVPSPGQPIIRI